MKKDISEVIEIPEGIIVEISQNGKKIISVKKDDKEIKRAFKLKNISIRKDGSKVYLQASKATRREMKLIKTIRSHIQNMIQGLEKPWVYKLKVCSSHFPMSVKLDKPNNTVTIKNFFGRNKERIVHIPKEVDVQVKEDIIEVRSPDKEMAGQAAATLEQSTRITKLDRRVFKDGIWIIEKAGRPV